MVSRRCCLREALRDSVRAIAISTDVVYCLRLPSKPRLDEGWDRGAMSLINQW